MFKRINKYFKSSLSLTFNNLHKKENYQQNFGKISSKKKFNKKISFNSSFNTFKQNHWKSYRNYKENEENFINSKVNSLKNNISNDYSRNKKKFKKKISLDVTEQSTLSLNEIDNNISKVLTKANSNSSHNSIFLDEYNRKKEVKNEEIILNKESNILTLKNMKKSLKTNFNKFNLTNNNNINKSITENTEILSVKIKISNHQIAEFKLRRFDNLFNTIKLFCEIHNIKETLIKPIVIKTLEALNNVYKIYNLPLSQNDIMDLNNIKEIYVQNI